MYGFGATSAKAAYNLVDQTIRLFDTTSTRWAACADDAIARLDVYPTLGHEVRHWLDHVTTLWGQKNLVILFNAMNARALNDPAGFWRVIDAIRALRVDDLDTYYTVIYDRSPPQTKPDLWQYQLTCGTRFDIDGRLDEASPIVFTRFAHQHGAPVARVPFSVTALLEACALFAEESWRWALIEDLDSTDARFLARKELERDTLMRLYAPELAVYHVAVHLVANQLNIRNYRKALVAAENLSSLALNLPDDCFDALSVPDELHMTWGERARALLRNRDRGFAFVLLSMTAPPLGEDLASWHDEVLHAAGLPITRDAAHLVGIEAERLVDTLIDGPFSERARRLLSFGRARLAAQGVIGMPSTQGLDTTLLPPLGFADGVWLLPSGTEAELKAWLAATGAIVEQLEEFYSVCGL